MSQFAEIKKDFFSRTPVSPDYRPGGRQFSDISAHLPVLEYYASLCRHVTEFGTRGGHSTAALVSGCRGEVHSWDIVETPAKKLFSQLPLPCSWHFHVGDTGSPDTPVEPTDLLFVDTLHTYSHVSKELLHHGRKAGRFLIFHDTFTCWDKDVSGDDPRAEGIGRAIEEFLAGHPGEYVTRYRTDFCNGLIVFERLDNTQNS